MIIPYVRYRAVWGWIYAKRTKFWNSQRNQCRLVSVPPAVPGSLEGTGIETNRCSLPPPLAGEGREGGCLLDRPIKPGDDSVESHSTEDHDVAARRASPANPGDAHRQPATSRFALRAAVRADDGAAL